mgnify:CR=1 FL=1
MLLKKGTHSKIGEKGEVKNHTILLILNSCKFCSIKEHKKGIPFKILSLIITIHAFSKNVFSQSQTQ